MFRAPKPVGKKSEATADIQDKFVHLDPANTYQDISRKIAHVRKDTQDEVDDLIANTQEEVIAGSSATV